MRGYILLGLLACAHGLGDVFPNPNSRGHSFGGTQNTNGWADSTGFCNTGTKQSPIDIVKTAATVPAVDPGALMANGFGGDRPVAWRVEGKRAAGTGGGTTTSVTFQRTNAAIGAIPTLSGGPLMGSYAFSHAEFHYGSSGNLGSEHTIDGTRASVELQFVFHKQKFTATGEAAAATKLGSMAGTNLAQYGANTAQPPTAYDLAVLAAAAETPDDPAGIAVVSYMIDVGPENAELKPITDSIVAVAAITLTTTAGAGPEMPLYITGGTSKTAITPSATNNVNMSTLMMLDQGALDDYFYYDGSLTLPADVVGQAALSCAEIVRWIIPSKRLTMSQAQVNAFHSNGGGGANLGLLPNTVVRNSRNVQTGARIAGITVNHRKPPPTPKDNAIWRNLAGSLLSVGTFGLVHNLLTQDDTAKALTENPVVDILQDIEQRFVRPAPQERQSFNHHHHPQDIQY